MNYYAEAIDIIIKHEKISRQLLCEVAKKNPKAVVDAFKNYNAGGHIDWQSEATALLRAGKKISAIKLCRELTGMGLKESKEAVDALPY